MRVAPGRFKPSAHRSARQEGSTVTRAPTSRSQGGVVLLVVLVFVLVTTMGASSLIQMYQTQARRDREEQLLFVGDQFRRALNAYYNTIPAGAARSLPAALEDLLEDHRFPVPLHHLRRIYLDPMTGHADWQLIRHGGGIVGIVSRSDQAPLKQKGFGKDYQQFEDASSYGQWRFVVEP